MDKDFNIIAINNKEKNNKQIFLILLITLIISITSGINRFLISLINNLIFNSSDSIFSYATEPAPLSLWLGLIFTIAPYGLVKAITGYYAGFFDNKKRTLIIAVFLYTIAVLLILLFLFLDFSGLGNVLVPASYSLIGASEGFFFASSQIILNLYATGNSRGKLMSISYFAIYGGYTIGSILTGLIISGQSFLFAYELCILLLIVIFGILVFNFDIKSTNTINNKYETPTKTFITEKNYSNNTESDKNKFKPTKLLKNPRILTILLGNHFSKWGDALVLLLPIYFAFLFSTTTSGTIIPDTIRIGYVLGVYTAFWAIGMFLTGFLTEGLGRKIPIVLGFIICGAGFLLLYSLNKNSQFIFEYSIVSMFLVGIGTGLYYPLLPVISLDIAKPKFAGQTLGLFRIFRDLGYFTGAITIIIIVFFVGSSIINISIAVCIIGILMISIAAVFIISLKETRPIWPFYGDLSTFSILIQTILIKTGKFINTCEKKSEEQILLGHSELISLFDQVYKTKKHLLKDILLPMRKKDDLDEFLIVIDLLEKIGKNSINICNLLLKLDTLVEENQQIVLPFLVRIFSQVNLMMNIVIETIDSINENPGGISKRQKKVSKTEMYTNELIDEFLTDSFVLDFSLESQRYSILFLLKDLSTKLENITNYIYDVSSTLTIIVLKHKF